MYAIAQLMTQNTPGKKAIAGMPMSSLCTEDAQAAARIRRGTTPRTFTRLEIAASPLCACILVVKPMTQLLVALAFQLQPTKLLGYVQVLRPQTHLKKLKQKPVVQPVLPADQAPKAELDAQGLGLGQMQRTSHVHLQEHGL